MSKIRMKNKKFAGIVLPLSAIALAATIALPIVGEMFSVTLDTALGKGQLHVVESEGTETWDTAYVNKKYSTDADAREAANKISKKVADDGIVLMKNDNAALPIAKSATVSPFGYGFVNPTYGGTGSGTVDATKDYVYNPEKALAKNFTINSTILAALKGAETQTLLEAEGTLSASKASFGGDNIIRFFNSSIYTEEVKTSCANTTGIVFIARGGGEGQDLKSDGYTDGTPHKLALSVEEKATIKIAKASCSKVVLIVNSSNVVELGDVSKKGGEFECDSIVWVGGPGAAGFESMSDVLTGSVNPSGRTVDIYETNLLNNPSMKNFGDFEYTNATYTSRGAQAPAHFVQYEEGIYIGYKYYETASELGAIDYGSSVVYPFGYGLSYTTFTQEIISTNVSGEGKVTMNVNVKNTGSVAGKDVVQAYYAAPYTTFDKDNKIEKAYKNLIDFGKTGIIEPGKSEVVTLTWGIDEMASYCYTKDNGDGTKGAYVLEAGDYNIFLGKNSHDSWTNTTYAQGATVWYNKNNARQSEKDGQSILDEEGKPTGIPELRAIDANAEFVAATNQFQSSSDFMSKSERTLLSRSSWSTTQPTAPATADFALDATSLAEFDKFKAGGFDVQTNSLLGNVETSEVYDNSEIALTNSGYSLSALRGQSYYSEEWNKLLAQVDFADSTTVSELRDLFYYGAYNTAGVTSLGKVATKDFDGPQGISSFMAKGDWCAYCSEVVVASTWNIDLVREYGNAIGQEGLASGISGWYGPAMNTHRSPFAGRNFEYYSEDGVLAGKIAASVVGGAADEGFYAYLKHFALNDQEINRTNYLCTWATEQTIREVYLKPFEICTKTARATLSYTADKQGTKATKIVRGTSGIMTAFNCIGPVMASSNYELLTNVLRNEWGFQGMVITDFGPTVNYDAMLRSGNDFLLNANWGGAKAEFTAVFNDTTSNTAKNNFRRAIKNMCFTVVNSSAYNNVAPGSTSFYDISPWRIGIYAATGVFGLLTIAGAGLTIYRFLDEKKRPDAYKK